MRCLLAAVALTPWALAQQPNAELLAALHARSADLVQVALQAGADPDARDPFGWTVLMLAVAQQDTEIIALLLAAGADVDAVDEGGRTALIEAAFGGSPAVVQQLLAAGADPDVTDAFGRTAMSLAAAQGHQAVVGVLDGLMAQRSADQAESEAAALAAAQAELRALASQADGARRARLQSDLAAQPRLFLTIARDTPAGTVREALELGADLNVQDDFDQTPLMYAAAGNAPEVISLLLAAGADAGHMTESGWTALMIAIRDNPDPGAVRALAAVPQDLLARNEDGATVLDLAVARGDAGLLAFLADLAAGQGLLPPPDGVADGAQEDAAAQPGEAQDAQPPAEAPPAQPVEPAPETPAAPVAPAPAPVTPPPATPAAPAAPVAPGEASPATRALVSAILDGGSVTDAQQAIADGADLHSAYFNQTPLSWAIDRDRRDIARLLVSSGARQAAGSWQPCAYAPGQALTRVQGLLLVDAAQAEVFMTMIDGFLWELQRRPALRRTTISVEQAIMGLSADTGPLDAFLALVVAWTGIDATAFDAEGRMGAGAREALYRFTFTDADGSLYSRRTAVSEANQRMLERAIAIHVAGGRVGGC